MIIKIIGYFFKFIGEIKLSLYFGLQIFTTI